jgi:two-component system response regulator
MTNARTILLVEDNPDDVELTVQALEKNRVVNPVIVATDGQDALDFLFGTGAHVGRNVSEMPYVVLLDLKLPRVDGLEVLRRIRADRRTRLLPVVVLTSSAHQEDLVGTYALGANSYIRKPVDFTQFITVAGQLALYWLVVNEVAPTPNR